MDSEDGKSTRSSPHRQRRIAISHNLLVRPSGKNRSSSSSIRSRALHDDDRSIVSAATSLSTNKRRTSLASSHNKTHSSRKSTQDGDLLENQAVLISTTVQSAPSPFASLDPATEKQIIDDLLNEWIPPIVDLLVDRLYSELLDQFEENIVATGSDSQTYRIAEQSLNVVATGGAGGKKQKRITFVLPTYDEVVYNIYGLNSLLLRDFKVLFAQFCVQQTDLSLPYHRPEGMIIIYNGRALCDSLRIRDLRWKDGEKVMVLYNFVPNSTVLFDSLSPIVPCPSINFHPLPNDCSNTVDKDHNEIEPTPEAEEFIEDHNSQEIFPDTNMPVDDSIITGKSHSSPRLAFSVGSTPTLHMPRFSQYSDFIQSTKPRNKSIGVSITSEIEISFGPNSQNSAVYLHTLVSDMPVVQSIYAHHEIQDTLAAHSPNLSTKTWTTHRPLLAVLLLKLSPGMELAFPELAFDLSSAYLLYGQDNHPDYLSQLHRTTGRLPPVTGNDPNSWQRYTSQFPIECHVVFTPFHEPFPHNLRIIPNEPLAYGTTYGVFLRHGIPTVPYRYPREATYDFTDDGIGKDYLLTFTTEKEPNSRIRRDSVSSHTSHRSTHIDARRFSNVSSM